MEIQHENNSQEEGVNSSNETQVTTLNINSEITGVELSEQEEQDLKANEELIDKGQLTFLEVGNALADIRDRRLYRVNYNSFETYLEKRWSMGKAHGYRLMEAAATHAHLSSIGDQSALPSRESQLRPFGRLKPEEKTEAWKTVQEMAGDEPITAKIMKEAAAPFKKPSKKKVSIKTETKEIPVDATVKQVDTVSPDDKAQEQMDGALTYLRSVKNLNQSQKDSWKRLLEQVVTALKKLGKSGSNPVE